MAAFELKPMGKGFAFGLDTETALRTPVGIAATAPLWMAFASVASAGVAYWWMRRFWTPTNLEAVLDAPLAALPSPEVVDTVTEAVAAIVEPVVEVAAAFMAEPAPAPIAEPEPVMTTEAEAAPEAELAVAAEPEQAQPIAATPRVAKASAPKAAAPKPPTAKPAARSPAVRRSAPKKPA